MARKDKTLPRIQKHFPESKTRPRIQKHFPESRFWDVFGFWEVFLDSGKFFWILGSVLESGKCFGFWEVFLDSRKCFGIWEVFWILGSVFGFWEVFWNLVSVLSLWATVLLNFASCVEVPGRAFLRRLIHLTRGVQKPTHHVRWTKESKYDLKVWLNFLRSYNGKSFFLASRWYTSKTLKLFTDAAGSLGYAAIFGKHWFSGNGLPFGKHFIPLS